MHSTLATGSEGNPEPAGFALSATADGRRPCARDAAGAPFSAGWPEGRAIAEALRPQVPRLIARMIAAISAEVPEYDRPLQGTFGENFRRGTIISIERFLATIAGERTGDPVHRQIYVELGRSELRSGRSLDSLLAAYRVGARVTWRHFSAAGQAAGIDAEQLFRLAEALFAYVDELSSESADGYTAEQALAHGRRDRERGRLLELLLAREPDSNLLSVRAQAERAGWPLPDLLTAVALPVGALAPEALQRRLPDDFMAAAHEGITLILCRDLNGPGRMNQLQAAVERAPAAIGPTVGPGQAAESIERASLGARLQQRGLLPMEGFIHTDEHMVELMVHRDARQAQALIDHALRPLQELTASARRRLTDTLEAWLDHACNTTEAAQALHVHPQTMRYRLRNLRETLGAERLGSAEGRLELALALRAAKALESAPAGS